MTKRVGGLVAASNMLEDTSYIADVSQESKQGQQTAQNISFEFSNIENVDAAHQNVSFEFSNIEHIDATHQNIFERELFDCCGEPKYI